MTDSLKDFIARLGSFGPSGSSALRNFFFPSFTHLSNANKFALLGAECELGDTEINVARERIIQSRDRGASLNRTILAN